MSSIKRWMQRHLIKTILIISIVLLAAEYGIINFLNLKDITGYHVTIGLITLIPPTAIAVIAFFQLAKLAQINIDEAVLQLDAQWRSEQIIRARKIVDVYFQQHYRIEKDSKDKYILSMEKVSIDILKLSKPQSKGELLKTNSNIVDLLCLIEFFDTLGYLYETGRDEVQNQIKNLFADSIKFYYKAFHAYIENASIHSNDRFNNFVNLYNSVID